MAALIHLSEVLASSLDNFSISVYNALDSGNSPARSTAASLICGSVLLNRPDCAKISLLSFVAGNKASAARFTPYELLVNAFWTTSLASVLEPLRAPRPFKVHRACSAPVFRPLLSTSLLPAILIRSGIKETFLFSTIKRWAVVLQNILSLSSPANSDSSSLGSKEVISGSSPSSWVITYILPWP